MDVKSVLKQWGMIFILIILSFLLQCSVFPYLELAGVAPNFLIILTSTFGFMKGRKEGIIVGFFCGLLMDLFQGSYLGLYSLLYLYIGYLNGFFRKIFFGDDLKLPLLLIGASDFLYGIIVYLFMAIVYHKYQFGFYLKGVMLPEVIYTVLVSVVYYYVILKWNQKIEKNKKRGSDSFV